MSIRADVTRVVLGRSITATQLAGAAPVYTSSVFYTGIEGADNDVTSLSVRSPSGRVASQGKLFDASNYELREQVSPNDLITDFQGGDYTLNVTSGNLAGKTGTVSVGTYANYGFVPGLGQTDWEKILNGNPTSDVTISFGAPSDIPGSSNYNPNFSNESELDIYDFTANVERFYPGSQPITLEQGFFKPGHHYTFNWYYSIEESNLPVVFDGKPVDGFYSNWYSLTSGFQVVPEPASVATVGLGVLLMVSRTTKMRRGR